VAAGRMRVGFEIDKTTLGFARLQLEIDFFDKTFNRSK
jgi:hypothetical protein